MNENEKCNLRICTGNKDDNDAQHMEALHPKKLGPGPDSTRTSKTFMSAKKLTAIEGSALTMTAADTSTARVMLFSATPLQTSVHSPGSCTRRSSGLIRDLVGCRYYDLYAKHDDANTLSRFHVAKRYGACN